MSVSVLKKKHQIEESRKILIERRLSCLDLEIKAGIMDKVRRRETIKVGDIRKSWDVLKSIDFLERYCDKADNILDLGTFSSELICALHKCQFQNLYGVDLNRKVKKMPFQDKINFVVGNYLETPFENQFFSAITAVSVIEHGFELNRLLSEVSRLLKKGGFFIASTDYWKDKISTDGIKIFDMDWKIFSQGEIEKIIEEAYKFSLKPFSGEIDFEVEEKTIECFGRDYTFIWFVLQKE